MDPSSLRLIEYALRLEAPARLLIVGTFRPGEATAAAFRTVLSQAASASSSIPFELPPLEEFEVAQLIEFESGQPPGAAYRQHVFERSEGNPFCVVELVRQTKQLADSGLGSAATSVPAGVWSMIATRLGRLPAECLNRLQAASVLGREFEVHELAVMLDADYRAVLGSLQPALDARILECASGDKQLAFAHILIRDGLYAELPLVRRNELHLAAADSIAPADGVLDHPFQERTARHRYVAAPAGDLERAIEACTSAARMLRKERFAFEEASRHWQRAVELLDLASEGNTNRRRQFLVSLAGCQYLSGDASTARATYLYAIDAARRAGDEVDLAHATLGLFDPNYRGNFSASFEDDTRNWIGLAREALDGLLETDQINLRAQLTSRLAIQLLRRHQLDDAEAESREALRLARRGCDSRIVAEVLADQHTLLIVRGEGELALESANEAVRLAQNSGDRARLLRSHLQLLDCGLASGDSALVRRQLDRVVSLGEPLGSYERRKMAIMEAILHGRVSAAWDLMIQVDTERRRGSAESSANVPDILQQHALQKLARGFGGLLPIFTQHVRQDPSNLLVKSWLARALAETNQHEAADKAVRELSDRAEDVFQRRDWQIVVLEHAAASAQLGSCAGAERFSDALRPLRDGFVLWPGGTLCCGSVAHALGLYAGLLERWAEADSHFELAIERSARLGARPFVIAGQTGWAWALLRRGTPVARAHAQTLLEVAIREASQLGFAGLEASARKLVA